MAAKLTIQIVGWNSATEIPAALAGLAPLPTNDVSFLYIDNASADNSIEIVKRLLPKARILALNENRGFTGAHNIGFSQCETPFILIHNPDFVINWSGVTQLLEKFNDPHLAAVQGKILKPNKDSVGNYIFDSAGIVLTQSLNGYDRGANEVDTGQYDEATKITAVTGAAGIYRMQALREVAHSKQEFFDEDFFAYKEDVDLGWRLTQEAWEVMYFPIVMGTHERAIKREGMFSWGLNPFRFYARLKSPRTRYSFRNWLWMILKNVTLGQLIGHIIFIKARIIIFIPLTLLYPPLFKVWVEILRGIPKMWAKRTQTP